MSDNLVREAVANFYAVGEKYINFGACDTEPRAEFALMLEELVRRGEAKVPQNWYLYSGMKGVGKAKAALSKAAQQVLDAAKADPAGAQAAYEYYFG